MGSEGYLSNWDTDNNSSEVVTVEHEALSSTELAEVKALTERSDAALQALPTETLEKTVEGDPCAICQDTMSQGDAVRRLPCAHIFHADCIEKWLRLKLTCPLCNISVETSLLEAAAPNQPPPAPTQPPLLLVE